MLCVALSLVFAGAAAANVLDGIQHAGESTGRHGHLVFSDISYGDHHADHGGFADESGQNGDADAAPAHHHHHGDGPLGFLSSVDAASGTTPIASAQLAPPRDGPARGTSPAGLERPPRRAENPV